MPDLLFVYGSLRSEFDNVHAVRLRTESRFAGPATVAGSIFLIGPYPGFRAEPGGVVQGEIYSLAKPAATLAHLDEYEGIQYTRVAVRLTSQDSEAWIYEYAVPLPLTVRIASGDFTRL
ncbi:MAG: gamma-glutamylcyclotransferase [Bryobacterales bacterium]|nr:gamma-glutamylcyclotransferase [Bryobacterales bacterium]